MFCNKAPCAKLNLLVYTLSTCHGPEGQPSIVSTRYKGIVYPTYFFLVLCRAPEIIFHPFSDESVILVIYAIP